MAAEAYVKEVIKSRLDFVEHIAFASSSSRIEMLHLPRYPTFCSQCTELVPPRVFADDLRKMP
jgi:hypothetical protein